MSSIIGSNDLPKSERLYSTAVAIRQLGGKWLLEDFRIIFVY